MCLCNERSVWQNPLIIPVHPHVSQVLLFLQCFDRCPCFRQPKQSPFDLVYSFLWKISLLQNSLHELGSWEPLQKIQEFTVRFSFFSCMLCSGSFSSEFVAMVFLRFLSCFIGNFPVVAPSKSWFFDRLASSSLLTFRRLTGSQAISASFTTTFTNSENGGKLSFSSFQLYICLPYLTAAHHGSFDTILWFSWSSSSTFKLLIFSIAFSHWTSRSAKFLRLWPSFGTTCGHPSSLLRKADAIAN